MRSQICLKVSDNDECFIDTLVVSTFSRLWVLKLFWVQKTSFQRTLPAEHCLKFSKINDPTTATAGQLQQLERRHWDSRKPLEFYKELTEEVNIVPTFSACWVFGDCWLVLWSQLSCHRYLWSILPQAFQLKFSLWSSINIKGTALSLKASPLFLQVCVPDPWLRPINFQLTKTPKQPQPEAELILTSSW